MIDRRALAALLIMAAGGAFAQPKRVVGFWMGPCDRAEARSRAISEELSRLGWRQPDQLRVETRCVAPNLEAAVVAAAEVAQSRPDAIVTQNSGATRELAKSTRSIPIVTSVGDPVRIGVAASLSRPGGNVTGLSQGLGDSIEKQLEVLRRLLPRLDRLLMVGGGGSEFTALYRETGKRMGVSVIEVTGPREEVRRHFDALPRDGTAAVYIPNVGGETAMLVREAVTRKLPVMAYNPEQVEEGEALIAYALEWRNPAERQAALLDKLLRGAKPAELPFEQPTESFLAINRKTAAMLGIEVPRDLLLQANWTN